jgi:autotransporter-associated beta strand protein
MHLLVRRGGEIVPSIGALHWRWAVCAAGLLSAYPGARGADPGSLTPVDGNYIVGASSGVVTISANLTDYEGDRTGLIAIDNGDTILTGRNTYTGLTEIKSGILEFGSSSALPPRNPVTPPDIIRPLILPASNLTIDKSGIAVAGYAIDQNFVGHITLISTGIAALGVNSASDLDFTGAPNVSLGVEGTATYSGMLTPGLAIFRLGGGAGTLTVTSILAGDNAMVVNGGDAAPSTVILTRKETYTGLTTIAAGTLIVGDAASQHAGLAGAALVESGATLGGYADIGGDLTNDGIVIPGYGGLPGALDIGGDYVQAASGRLVLAVTPRGASLLDIAGAATLGGTLELDYAPGTYHARSYTLIHAADGVTGKFETVIDDGAKPKSLRQDIVYGADDVALRLGEIVVRPKDNGLFGAQLTTLAGLADDSVRSLIGEAGLAGAGRNRDCAPGDAAATSGLLDDAPCAAGGWLHVHGGAESTEGLYHSSTGGFLAGIDRPVGDHGLTAGVAVGYDQNWLHDWRGGEGGEEVLRLALYASQTIGETRLDAAFYYGHDWAHTDRLAGPTIVRTPHSGEEFGGGEQASVPIALDGLADGALRAAAGVRFAIVAANGFAETAPGALAAFAVTGRATTFSSVLPFAGLEFSHRFVTDSGVAITPEVTAGYQYQAADTGKSLALVAADGTVFASNAIGLDRNSALLDAKFGIGRESWRFFADYSANLSGNWTNQSLMAGFRLIF